MLDDNNLYKYTYTCVTTYVHNHASHCITLCTHMYTYVRMYIYIYGHPATTRTPLKNTVNTDANAAFFRIQCWSCSYRLKTQAKNKKSKKIKKSKNQKPKNKKKSKNQKLVASTESCIFAVDFWIFVMLECWISGCLWISAHQELHFRVP